MQWIVKSTKTLDSCYPRTSGVDAVWAIMRFIAELTPFISWSLAVILFSLLARRTPNMLLIAGLILAAAGAIMDRSPFSIGSLEALYGFAAAFIAFLPLFVARLIGGADLKVFAVLGAWCGIHEIFIIWTAATCAVVILLAAAYANKERNTRSGLREIVTSQSGRVNMQPTNLTKFGSAVPYTVLLVGTALLSLVVQIQLS